MSGMADRKQIRITNRVLETEDHDDCPFCLGRAAAHRGDSMDTNPFPEIDYPKGSEEQYEDDHWLWDNGYSVGSMEPGGLLWYEQPNRDARVPQD